MSKNVNSKTQITSLNSAFSIKLSNKVMVHNKQKQGQFKPGTENAKTFPIADFDKQKVSGH